MVRNRWREDERGRWDENRYGRRGSSSGWWGQEGAGQEYDRPDYESSGYGQEGYPEYERRGRDEEYGRQFGRDEYGQRYGQEYRGGYDYERGRSGSGYGGGSVWGPSGGYPYRSGQYGGSSRWRGSELGQDWRRQGGMGYGGYEGRYGSAYGGDWNQERGLWDRTRDEMRSWMGDDEAERRRRMDEMRQRSHYGRGPRGFTRSDERIREDVCERLTYDWNVDASDVEVNVSKGEVTLTGSVDGRYTKRCAEDIAEAVPGVQHVQNNLRVKEATESMTGTTGTTTTATGSTTRPTH